MIWALLACAEVAEPDGAAVFADSCVPCHGAGATPPLDDPQTVAGLATLLADVVRDGRMPPWPPTAAGVPLRDDPSLSNVEATGLLAWLDAGASGRVPDAEVESVRPDFVIELPEVASDGSDWRCLLVEVPDAPMVAYDVVADGVHHALLGTFSDLDGLRALDAADPAPGWSCPDAFVAGEAETVPILWFPGPTPARAYPGTGIPLGGGTAVVQLHLLGGSATASLVLELDETATPEIQLALGTDQVDLPDDEWVVELQRKAFVGDWRGDGEGLWLTGLRGHGHEQLQRLRILADDRVLLDLDWDPHLQQRYVPVEPVWLAPDAVLALECTYDNSPAARASASLYGESEMCGGWVFGL